MNVGSVNSAYGNVATQATQRKPDTAAVRNNGAGNGVKPQNGGANGVNSTPSPTVNTSGQTVGQVINVKA